MELSLRVDTLGMVEVRYLRGRERYRDWPTFLLLAASRQARVWAYLNREVIDQLHQQILAVEEAAGLGVDSEDDDEEEDNQVDDTGEKTDPQKAERESSTLSPAFAQALERLNDLARQRLPEAGSSPDPTNEDLTAESDITLGDEEDEENLETRTASELQAEGTMKPIELALILRLYEESRARTDDLPAVELQLDVDDFERLHETLDFAIDRERRNRRRR